MKLNVKINILLVQHLSDKLVDFVAFIATNIAAVDASKIQPECIFIVCTVASLL